MFPLVTFCFQLLFYIVNGRHLVVPLKAIIARHLIIQMGMSSIKSVSGKYDLVIKAKAMTTRIASINNERAEDEETESEGGSGKEETETEGDIAEGPAEGQP